MQGSGNTSKGVERGTESARVRYNEQRRLRYALVLQRTQDVELARKSRQWSDEKLFDEMRIRVPVTPKKRAEVKRPTLYRTPEEVAVRQRENQWAVWASAKTYPRGMKGWVTRWNRSQGYDPHAKYGWALMFYRYTQGLRTDVVKDNLKASRVYGGELYQTSEILKKGRR